MKGSKPPAMKQYKTPVHFIDKVKTEIQSLLDKGIIQTSSSFCSYPAFPILKRVGSINLVVN